MEGPGSSAQEVSAAVLPAAKMTLSYSSCCEAEGAAPVLADGGLRWQWLLSTQGLTGEKGTLSSAFWPGRGHVLPAGGSNVPPGETGLGTHFPRPHMGWDCCAR